MEKNSIGKKIKFLNFFFQNYNHYDSTTCKEKSNPDFFLTAKTPSDFKISPKNPSTFQLSVSNESNPIKSFSRTNSLDDKLKDILLKTTKSRNFNLTPLNSFYNEIPKIQVPNRTFEKSENEIKKTYAEIKIKEFNEIKEEVSSCNNNNFQKNVENNKKIQDHLYLLTQNDKNKAVDKKTWKESIFRKGKEFNSIRRVSQESFSIYSHNEKRKSFINELNYRLHYRVPKQMISPCKKKQSSSIPNENLKKRKRLIKALPLKNTLNYFNEKNEENVSKEKLKNLRINLSTKNLKATEVANSLSFKVQDPDYPLPSDERIRYFLFPILLMQNLCENLNYFKILKNPKCFYNKIEQICGSNMLIKKSILDLDNGKVIEPITPRSLYSRFLLNEKKSNYNYPNEAKKKQFRKSQMKSLFFNNPLKKVEKETSDLIIEFNTRLEEQKILLEKKKMDHFRKTILDEHKIILEEEIGLVEKYKTSMKKERYLKLKSLLMNCEELNITIPSSDIFKQIKKLGNLKFIKKDNIANLQDFERFLYEIKNSEMLMNEEIQ